MGTAVAINKAGRTRRGYEAFQSGDLEMLRTEVVAPDIVWHDAGENPTAGDHHGVDATLANFAKLFELSEGSFRVEVHDILESDDHVVVLGTASGSRKGRSMSQRYAQVMHFRDGRIAEAWIFGPDQKAVDEFWTA